MAANIAVKSCGDCKTKHGEIVLNLLHGTHDLSALTTSCRFVWNFKFPGEDPPQTPLSVLNNWIQAQNVSSVEVAKARLSVLPLPDTERKLVVGLLFMKQEGTDMKIDGILSQKVVVKRKTDAAREITVERLVLEKTIAKMNSKGGKGGGVVWAAASEEVEDVKMETGSESPGLGALDNNTAEEGDGVADNRYWVPGSFDEDIDWGDDAEESFSMDDDSNLLQKAEEFVSDTSSEYDSQSEQTQYAQELLDAIKDTDIQPKFNKWFRNERKKLERKSEKQAAKVQKLTDRLKMLEEGELGRYEGQLEEYRAQLLQLSEGLGTYAQAFDQKGWVWWEGVENAGMRIIELLRGEAGNSSGRVVEAKKGLEQGNRDLQSSAGIAESTAAEIGDILNDIHKTQEAVETIRHEPGLEEGDGGEQQNRE